MATKKDKIIVIETFRSIGLYEISNIQQDIPTCFNGFVNYRKTKVTIEVLDEPKEVLTERLQNLWDNCDNYHHFNPLREEAKKIGYELIGSPGSKKPKKPKNDL